MVTYDDTAIKHLIDQSVDAATDRLERKWDRKINEAIERATERAVGFYYEKTKHDIELVLESTGFIKTRLEDMVTRDEFNELKTEVGVIKKVVTATNKDLRHHGHWITKLEKAVFHA